MLKDDHVSTTRKYPYTSSKFRESGSIFSTILPVTTPELQPFLNKGGNKNENKEKYLNSKHKYIRPLCSTKGKNVEITVYT